MGVARVPRRGRRSSISKVLVAISTGALLAPAAAWPAAPLRMPTARKVAAQRTLELARLVVRDSARADRVTGHGVQSCRRVTRTRVRCKTWSRIAYAGRTTYCGYQVDVRRGRRGISTRISQRGACAVPR